MPQDNPFCFDLAGSDFEIVEMTTDGEAYIADGNPSKSYELKPFETFANLDFDLGETIQEITFRQEGESDTTSRIYDLQVYNVSNDWHHTHLGIQFCCTQLFLNALDFREYHIKLWTERKTRSLLGWVLIPP